MIKLTINGDNTTLYLAVQHIVAVQSANPKGCLIHCTRSTYHVSQSADQVQTLLKNWNN